MGKRSKKTTHTLVTPTIDLSAGGGFVRDADDKLSYWKQILPEAKINYRTDDGETLELDFNRESNQELIDAYKNGAMAQTPFMLADRDNAHTMDPERYRADVVDMRQAEDGEDPGIYAKVKFASKKAAKSVLNNPALGVSARIRPNVENARTGAKFQRAIIHVLGTLDPKITGMSAWTPAVDLSAYAHDDIIDLSGMTYTEAAVPKIKRNGEVVTSAKFAAMTDDEIEAAEFTEAEITQLVRGMDDETLAEYVAKFEADDDTEPDENDDDDEPEGDDTDEPEGEDGDDAEDGDDGDSGDGSDSTDDRQLVGVGADLSNDARRDIDLANARAAEADRNARKALKAQADAEWKAARVEYENDGVPPWVLDLAKPVLSGSDDITIDLSNTGGEKNVNATAIVRKLVNGYRGDVDLSREDIGHGDAEGSDRYASDRAALAALDI